MASHIYPIPEVHRSVTRPVTIEIIRQVLKLTGLNPDKFRTKMLGYSDAVAVPGSTLDEVGESSKNRLTSDEKLTLEVKEEDVGDLITPVRYPDQNPIFHDTDLKIMMKPVLSLSKVTISVVINVPSRVRAFNWLAEVKRRIYQANMTNYHTIDYHYPIPKPFIYYLVQMHRMRETVEPLNESFGEWLKRCFVNRWTVISNQQGHERMVAIQEKQTNIYGWFDFDFEPQKPEKESDNAGGWQIQFDYSFHYQRPDSLVFAYPLVIHNQLLPIEMIQTDRPEHVDTYAGYQGLTGSAYDQIVIQNNANGMFIPPGIPYPRFDDWYPCREPAHYLQIARTLTMVDLEDKTTALDLTDMSDDFSFKDSVVRFMKDVNWKMLVTYKSIFHVQLYRWDSFIGYPDVTLGSDLLVKTTFDLNPKDMWHVVVYVLTDISKLDPDGWEDIMKNCDVFHEWLEAIYGDKYKDLIRCNTDNTVNQDDLDKVINDINKGGNNNGNGNGSNNGNNNGNNGNDNNGGGGGTIIPGLPQHNERFVAGYTLIARKFMKGADNNG